MFKNYIKSALHSLWRRKWFSLLTLLSIAISLVVVISMASFWNMLTAPIKPETNKERIFYLQKEFSRKNNGEKLYYQQTKGLIDSDFYRTKIMNLQGVEVTSIFNQQTSMSDLLINGRGKSFDFKNTDSNFFKIFDFEFIDGVPYTNEIISLGESAMVISDKVANFFFGTPYCAGKELTRGYSKAKIIGVFKTPSHVSPFNADVYFGVSEKKLLGQTKYYDYDVAFLLKDKSDSELLNQQIASLGKKISSKSKDFNMDLSLVSSVKKLISKRYQFESKFKYVILILLILILPIFSLFELLKSNLIFRIEEIGARRAFGATNWNVQWQLVFENILLTILGGVLGTLISLYSFKIISGNSLSNIIVDFFNWRAVLYFLGLFVVLGLVSGAIPAFQIGRLQIITSLQNLDRKKVVAVSFLNKLSKHWVIGVIIVITFFVIALSFNEVYTFLKYSVKSATPVKLENRISIEVAYQSGAIKFNNDPLKGKLGPNLDPVHNEVKHAIEQIRGVESSSFSEFSIENSVSSYWDLRNNESKAILCGFDFYKVFDLNIIDGRWFSKDDILETILPVVLTKSHAASIGIEKLGKNTFFEFKSQLYDTKFRVVGIIEDIGLIHGRGNLKPFFAPVAISQENSVSGDYRMVKIKDDADMDEVIASINELYLKNNWDKKMYQFQVTSFDDIMKEKLINHISYYPMEYGIILLTMLFIAIILFGSSWRQVQGRVQELGIRRSVGANRWRILRMVILEKILFFVITIAVAVVLYLNVYESLQIKYSVIAPAISALLIFIMVMLATIIPALRAAGIKPVEALAEE